MNLAQEFALALPQPHRRYLVCHRGEPCSFVTLLVRGDDDHRETLCQLDTCYRWQKTCYDAIPTNSFWEFHAPAPWQAEVDGSLFQLGVRFYDENDTLANAENVEVAEIRVRWNEEKSRFQGICYNPSCTATRSIMLFSEDSIRYRDMIEAFGYLFESKCGRL